MSLFLSLTQTHTDTHWKMCVRSCSLSRQSVKIQKKKNCKEKMSAGLVSWLLTQSAARGTGWFYGSKLECLSRQSCLVTNTLEQGKSVNSWKYATKNKLKDVNNFVHFPQFFPHSLLIQPTRHTNDMKYVLLQLPGLPLPWLSYGMRGLFSVEWIDFPPTCKEKPWSHWKDTMSPTV